MRQASDRLTIEPGLRVGFYHGAVPADGVPSYDTSSVSPRIGAAWDLTPDHRSAVRAHYGLYHDGVFANLYDQFDPASHPGTVLAKVIGPNQFQEITR
jgi:outer membrane receptor protein involved in Fe transport